MSVDERMIFYVHSYAMFIHFVFRFLFMKNPLS